MKRGAICEGSGCERGFTLIELLVVIGIIAILMAFTIPAYSKFKQHAVRMKAKETAKAIELALRAYMQEYNRWPSIIDDEDPFDLDGDIVEILRGENVGGDNEKKICFIEWDDPEGGGVPVMLDPFTYADPSSPGEPYKARVDLDFDNQIDHFGDVVFRPVIVWSWGGNTVGTPESKAKSDEAIRSWD